MQGMVPPEMLHLIGRPLRLKKGLYGYTLSGRFWHEELASWLKSSGYIPTPSDPSLYIKREHKRFTALLVYIDDVLYFSSDTEMNQTLEKLVTTRFHVELLGNAQWYLNARIQRDAAGNYTLDQTQFVKAIIQRYLPSGTKFACPPNTYHYHPRQNLQRQTAPKPMRKFTKC